MVAYDLTHLTQPEDQLVVGSVQDDEALFLYALIRCMRLRRILGGRRAGRLQRPQLPEGDGPRRRAVDGGHQVHHLAAVHHSAIRSSCGALTGGDVGGVPLNLVFFDCHICAAQMTLFHNLSAEGVIDRNTVLALHDTNLHPAVARPDAPPRGWGTAVEGGWMHQAVERQMVNTLRNEGYDALMLHTTPDRHDSRLPLRHGLTILTRARHLDIGEIARPLDETSYVGSEYHAQSSDEPPRGGADAEVGPATGDASGG